jgi:phage shock protein C
MFCTKCGTQLADEVRFCSQCGTATSLGAQAGPTRAYGARLERVAGTKMAGVCAGFARYFGVDVTLVRIVWILLTIVPPSAGALAYLICWIVMPMEAVPAPPAAAPPAAAPQQPQTAQS